MEDGSATEAAKGKAISSSSLVVVEIERDKMLEGSRTLLDEMTAQEKASSGSSVADIEEKTPAHSSGGGTKDELIEVEMARWERQSIYRVPEFIKKETNRDAYVPQFVSLGPLHHGEAHLLPMEEHKHRAVRHMANRAGKHIQEYIAAIDAMVDELQAAYGDLELDDTWRGAHNRPCFVQMMVTDGCFLLELIRTATIVHFQTDFVEMCNDYATNDPIFSKRSFWVLWTALRNDMISMENQLPLVVLQRLLAVQYGSTSLSAQDINNFVLLLLGRLDEEGGDRQLGLHPLDVYYNSYLRHSFAAGRARKTPQDEACHVENADYEPHPPRAVELSEAGIQFKKSDTDDIQSIGFENGVLSMPLFVIGDDTERVFLNLMAFEWLHADAKGDVVSSYISFMDKIIESERDVALLRSNGLIRNFIGSDKKVAETFNTLTKLARTPGRRSGLGYVIRDVNAHCRKRRNKWRAILVKTYFSNPWVFISMVAAVILLVATLLQTVYTIVPFYTKG